MSENQGEKREEKKYLLPDDEISRHQCLKSKLPALSKPWPEEYIEWRAGATNKEKTKAMALAYVDMRRYAERLNQVVPGWQMTVQNLPAGKKTLHYIEKDKHTGKQYDIVEELPASRVMVCITVCGVTRCDVGEDEPGDNSMTTAFAQAFKRAAVQFGVGAYLYSVGRQWVKYDAEKRRLAERPRLPKWALP